MGQTRTIATILAFSGCVLAALVTSLAIALTSRPLPGSASAATAIAVASRPASATTSTQAAPMTIAQLNEMIRRLEPIHTPLGKPQPGDWLLTHKEPGQTFAQYIASKPNMPQGRRKVLYIQPLGEFTATQGRIVHRTADFMGLYFNLPVRIKDDLPLDQVPDSAKRTHPQTGEKQLLTGYLWGTLLKPMLPDDGAAMIGFTASDLWPGEGWNFVFGEASLVDRVGVWSIARNGEPDKGDAEFRLCLLRTMKTATHETGHMFGMLHCTAYECNMCGSNNRDEADRRPLALCPQCQAKLCWATGARPAEQFERLAKFCRDNGLKDEAQFYQKSLRAMTTKTD